MNSLHHMTDIPLPASVEIDTIENGFIVRAFFGDCDTHGCTEHYCADLPAVIAQISTLFPTQQTQVFPDSTSAV